MAAIDFSKVPETAKIELCTLAILQTAAALATPEGRAAMEKVRPAYEAYLARKSAGAAD